MPIRDPLFTPGTFAKRLAERRRRAREYFVDQSILTVGGLNFDVAISEPLTADDTPDAFKGFILDAADNNTLIEFSNVQTIFAPSISEPATATDSPIAGVNYAGITITELLNATDSQIAVVTYNAVISESAPATDFSTTGAIQIAAITEAALATSVQDSAKVSASTILETASATDTVTLQFVDGGGNQPAPLVRDYWDGWQGNFYPGAGTHRIT
jgi:hypothetical protein